MQKKIFSLIVTLTSGTSKSAAIPTLAAPTANIESSSDDDKKQEDDNRQDFDEENTQKAYYAVKKNIKISKIGLPTGKYKFYAPAQ